ncbi:MAG: YbaB/EbfC family nucleoid-associated protein [bacterium]|nr:YbaB/EbfC family nucleoid-associated protein [bacterium]
MNMQALMRQAQAMQKELTNTQKVINETEFTGKNGVVTVRVMGTKEVKEVKIDDDKEILDDVSLLSDMVLLALNDAFKQVDKFKEEKLGKYANMMQGLM